MTKKEIIGNILNGTNLTLDDYISYSYDNDIDIALAVAKSQFSPIDALSMSSIDGDPLIRKTVCENPNVTEKILFELSKDKDEEVSEIAQKELKRRFNK